MVGVIRFAGETPWERHPGDELLYVVEGAVDVTVLSEAGRRQATVGQGEIFVVPRHCWHRQQAQRSVSLMFVTPADGTDASRAEDPRRA